MKAKLTILMALVVICLAAFSANADVYVRGYVRSNGTYVQPHYRSNPDGNFYNNWSTKPNINPYTGKMGTKITPDYSGGSLWRAPSSNFGTLNRLNSFSYSSRGLLGGSLLD